MEAVERLDPEDDPHTVVCRRRDGAYLVQLWKAVYPFRPPLDGLPCRWTDL